MPVAGPVMAMDVAPPPGGMPGAAARTDRLFARLLSRGVLACVAAGIGLWCTRATLDVTDRSGRVMRVAMLPSWPDLLGGIWILLLAALLGRTLLRQLDRGRAGGADQRVTDRLLVPLFALLSLLLPFAPWLSDAIPVVRALAGPAAIGVWLVIVGAIAWTAHDVCFRRASPGSGRVVTPTRVAAVFAIALGVYGGTIYPGGDEPHYLVITQSLLHDRSLAIEATHVRGDYRAYFPRPLKPDYRVRGADGRIYSIHSIGLAVLVLPVFAAAGYRGVAWFLALLSALAATLAWAGTARISGSAAAATVGWMAAALSAPFVLHSFAVYPEAAAGFCAVAALWGTGRDEAPTWKAWLLRGFAAAALPWLGTKYAPMSAVIVAAMLLRARADATRGRVAIAVPYGLSLAAWFVFFFAYWGSPLPSAPYGPDHQTSAANLLIGVPGVLVDQEYGVLAYAPALLFAVPGFIWLWRRGGGERWRAIEAALAFGALTITVGAFAIWWGGSAPPGRELVAGLLLLALPVAGGARALADRPVLRWMLRLLTLAGLVVTWTMVAARNGLLIANGRDGASELLEWLLPTHELARVMPTAIAGRGDPLVFFGVLATWIVVVGLVALLARRLRAASSDLAMLWAFGLIVAGIAGGSAAVAFAWGSRLPRPLDPAARGEAPMLAEFDARRRPLAISYDAFTRLAADAVPPLFPLAARPGERTDPQPLRVLLNMRVALPVGRYRVVLQPRPGERIAGAVALQVGRTGDPLRVWHADAADRAAWSERFDLPVDANFVGLRGAPDLERRIDRVTFEPERVANQSDRPALPAVLGARHYGDSAVYFHGGGVYPEEEGFWVRGRSTLIVTFAPDSGAIRPEGIHLKMHGAARPMRVRLAAGGWTTDVSLDPRAPRDVYVPARAGSPAVTTWLSPLDGFVPAEHDGGADRRELGCWVEVVP